MHACKHTHKRTHARTWLCKRQIARDPAVAMGDRGVSTRVWHVSSQVVQENDDGWRLPVWHPGPLPPVSITYSLSIYMFKKKGGIIFSVLLITVTLLPSGISQVIICAIVLDSAPTVFRKSLWTKASPSKWKHALCSVNQPFVKSQRVLIHTFSAKPHFQRPMSYMFVRGH